MTGDGYQLSLPARWKQVHLGIAGELGRYETQSDVLTVMRASGSALIDDIYRGTADGRPELLRQFTTVIGTHALALLFRYIEPNEAQALSESSSIAASWRVRGR